MIERSARSPWDLDGATQAERTILYNLYAKLGATTLDGVALDIRRSINRIRDNIRQRTPDSEPTSPEGPGE